MADILNSSFGQILKRFRDMLDGTLAEVVVLGANTGTVGRVGGITGKVMPDVQPVVQAAAYATGALCGGKLKLSAVGRTGVGSGMVQSAVITSKSVQTCSFDVILFSADPTATTFTDKSVFTVDPADQIKVVGVLHANDVSGLSACSIHMAVNAALPFVLTGVDMWAAIVVRGAPTFASTSDLQMSLRSLQD